MKKILIITLILLNLPSFAQQLNSISSSTTLTEHKALIETMMYDYSYNFYEAVDVAEAYFNRIDKNAKGSGFKPYMRWKVANEYKYYPDGIRQTVDPYFAEKQYLLYLKNNKQNKALFNGNWKELGPATIDSITGHYSAGLGRIEDFYVDPNNANKIYLGSRSGGFWRTTDGGLNWQNTSDFLMATGVNAITASPYNSDSVLINVRNSRNGTSYGVYKSDDGGLTFSPTALHSSTFPFGGLGTAFQIYEIAYHPSVQNLVFVASNEGIFRSTDHLQTMGRILPNSDVTELAFHPTNANIIYAYANNSGNQGNQIFRSVNGGLSFQRTGIINGNNLNTSVEIATSPLCDSCVFFASDNGVWISKDESLTWNYRGNSSQNCDGFAVSDLDTSVMVYGALDLDNSTDGGRNFVNRTRWSLGNTNGNTSSLARSYNTSTNYVHADVRNMKVTNGVFYAATDGFLCKSTNNGLDWQILSGGVATRENYKLGLSQSNHFRTMVGSQDNGTSINTEKGWVEFYGADGMEAIIHPLNEDWMIGSVQFGNRRKTTDGGHSQSSVTPVGSSGADWEAPLAFDPNNPMTIYDFRAGIYKSTDFGETHNWLSNTGLNGNIDEAEIAYNNSDIIVISQGSSIRKSTNGGLTFSNIKSNLPNYSIEDIAINPNNDDEMVVVYGRYQADQQKVYLTTNGGTTWTNITTNLGSMPIRSVVIDHSDSSYIYVGAEIGVFVKSLSGTNWSLYNPGFPNTTAKELEINRGSNTLRAATWGRGLWEYHLVGKANFPAIMFTSITSPPTLNSPKIGINQFVTSSIHYSGTLSSVYVEWSKDSATFNNAISMSHIRDSTWQTTAPFPQFSVGSKIYFRVMAVGSANDTTESYKFMYEIHPFDYCNASGNGSSGNLYLSTVSINGQTNNSGNNSYTHYVSPVIELFEDSSYAINLIANTSWSRNDFAAWIDYNNNADFETNEQVLFQSNAGNTSTNVFTVPKNISIGDTVRMRVRLSYWSDPKPCGDVFGEVEDYQIKLNGIRTEILKIELDDEKFRIYPNPNNGSFKVEFKAEQPIQLLEVLNVIGEVIWQKRENDNEVTVNLNLPDGIYFMRINKYRLKKFVIVH